MLELGVLPRTVASAATDPLPLRVSEKFKLSHYQRFDYTSKRRPDTQNLSACCLLNLLNLLCDSDQATL